MFTLEKINKFISKNWFFIVISFFLLTSTAPLFWYRKISYLYQYIGRGDFLVPIDLNKLLNRDLFTLVFNYAGIDNTANIAHFIPANFFYYILYRLNINSIQSALLLISFIIFISQVSFYCLITYLNQKYGKNVSIQARLTAIISGILYGYSPFVLALIAPGHVYLLFNYAVFPLIVKYFDNFINIQNIKIKNLFYLFIFFLFSSTSYANIAIIYVNIIILGIYSFLKIIIEKKALFLVIRSFFITCFLIFLSNSWWLFSYIYNIISNNLLSYATSSVVISKYISTIPTASFMFSILFGKVMFNYVVKNKNDMFNFLNIFSMIFLWLFFIKEILKKMLTSHKYIYTFLIFNIIIIFLLKGNSDPFSAFYNNLYFYIPGFVSLRNSVNKFYGFFWLSLLVISSISISETLNKIRSKKILNFFLMAVFFFISLFYIFIFIKTPQLGIFNIPDYYKEVNKRLKSKNNTKNVLLLPSFDSSPFFGSDSNYYHGTNYISEIIDFPILTAGSSDLQIDYPYKKLTEKINFNILHNKPICEYFKKLNISDVIVLKDINENVVSVNNLVLLLSNMKKMQEFSYYKLYQGANQNGIYLFEVNSNCFDDFINLKEDNNSLITYNIINPVTIQVEIKNLNDIVTLQFLTNYNNNWVAIMQEYNKKQINIFDLLFNKRLLNSKQPKPLYDYANSWLINKNTIINTYDSNFYKKNSDGSIDVKFVLYYKVQNYLYFGLIFFLVFSILGACFFLIFDKLKK